VIAGERRRAVRSQGIGDRGELHRRAQLGLVDDDVIVRRELPRRERAAADQLEQHRDILGVERVRVVPGGAGIERAAIERDQSIGIDMAELLLGGRLELQPRVLHDDRDRARRNRARRRIDDPLQALAIAEQMQQAQPGARDLVILLDTFRWLPADEVIEHCTHRGMTLEPDHLGHRAFARALRQPGECGPRAVEQPVIEHRDLEPPDAEPLGEQAHEPAQALGRHQHERAKPPALRAGAAVERGDAIQRHERLADPGLAIDHEGRIAWQIDRGLLLGIEHDRLAAIDRLFADGSRPRHGSLALPGHDPIVTDERVDAATPDEPPALEDPAALRAGAGLDLVRLARPMPEEHLGERRGSPVEHRGVAVEHRARPEQILARAAIGLDHEHPLRRWDTCDGCRNALEAHGPQYGEPGATDKLPTVRAPEIRSSCGLGGAAVWCRPHVDAANRPPRAARLVRR
jgi:hypothetical protein